MNEKNLVVIIEDEQDLLDTYSEVLRDAGFETVGKRDGYDGLDAIIENQNRILAVMLDLMMPGVDGLEVLRQIKGSPDKYGKVPVIVVTNVVSERVSEEAISAGADAYILKTELTSDDLIKEIMRVSSK